MRGVYFFSLLIFSLSSMAEGTNVPSPKTEVIIKNVGCNSGPYQPKLPNSLKGIKALGKTQNEIIEPTLDYENENHIRGSFVFDGMVLVGIFDKKDSSVSFIELASFSSPRWNKISPIAIGSSIKDLFAKEGIAKVPKKNGIVYACSSEEGAPDCIKITLNKLIIAKTEYECYTG